MQICEECGKDIYENSCDMCSSCEKSGSPGNDEGCDDCGGGIICESCHEERSKFVY